MEDNSYVSLSLDKYNELYDKAKKYDEIKFKIARKGMFDFFKDYGVMKESAATEENDDEIKVGDKVRLIDINDKVFKAWFTAGDICEVIEIPNNKYCLNKDGFNYRCNKSEIEKINEGEEK